MAKTIDVSTSPKTDVSSIKDFFIPEPCPTKGCPYVTAPGHSGLCMKHWNEKYRDGKNRKDQ